LAEAGESGVALGEVGVLRGSEKVARMLPDLRRG
jgi:hypothetical protein